MGVSVETRPGGYRLRLRDRRPPHFQAERGEAFRTGAGVAEMVADPSREVEEILRRVQHFIGHETGAAWPSSETLPPITHPVQEMVTHRFEQHRAELQAWITAYPQPFAHRDGDTIHAGCGPRDAPLLRLAPLRVT
jgi:hypothetical protein